MYLNTNWVKFATTASHELRNHVFNTKLLNYLDKFGEFVNIELNSWEMNDCTQMEYDIHRKFHIVLIWKSNLPEQ